MKRLLILFIAGFTLSLNSCSTKDAEIVADEFHEKLDAKDIDYIVNNLIDNGEGSIPKEDWTSYLELIVSWGEQTNREQSSGFSKKINNGITTVKLKYTFDLEERDFFMYERLILIDRGEGDGYKLLNSLMNSDESVVIEETKDY